MDSVENLNYLSQYQRLLFKSEGKVTDANRNCLIQTYSASLKLLDHEEGLNLLDENLNQYTKNLDDNNRSFKLNGKAPDKHSCLDGIDLRSLLTPLSCNFNDNIQCEQMKNNTEKNFQAFLSSYKDKAELTALKTIEIGNKSELNDVKDRRTVKCFAPRNHLAKDNKKPAFSLTPPEPVLKEANIGFRTAREELHSQTLKQGNRATASATTTTGNSYIPAGGVKRKLGIRRTVHSKFISPMLSNSGSNEELPKSDEWSADEGVDERLKNIDPKMVELIKSEIMDNGPAIQWEDIAGLESPKTAIQEAVVWPLLRPDIFTGLRKPPKGILLFGPPGTGKTLIGKCVASQSKSTFFSISASSLTSKWIGDGEKMVRALFAVASCHQPAVIFIDEVDSLLSQRSETEHESSRRLKTEFLVRLDGATTASEDRVLVIGATNRPQELDEAARRRFVKRLYIPLPDFEARYQIVSKLMSKERNSLTNTDIHKIAELSDGYSGADMKNLCSEASFGPIRCLSMNEMATVNTNEVRPVDMNDFTKALSLVRPSVSPRDLNQYLEWNQVYGSGCVA